MDVLFNLQVDCEATQQSVADPALGERALRGLAALLAEAGLKATFVAIPGDLRAHAGLYRELVAHGHEVGLHTHPKEEGHEEFLGVYGPEQQQHILAQAAQVFGESLGFAPRAFTPGYFSANDHTFAVLEALGFTHGMVSLPTRSLPQCASVWAGAPLDPHYPHRYNRLLTGDVDFVDVPPTVDPDSRLWGGAQPQDLRIELVDAKNHWYTLHKSLRRQLAAQTPVKYFKALTHNVFDYSDPRDFRRETLQGVIAAARQICQAEGVQLVPATTADIANAYRAAVPRPGQGQTLTLDTRGRAAWRGAHAIGGENSHAD